MTIHHTLALHSNLLNARSRVLYEVAASPFLQAAFPTRIRDTAVTATATTWPPSPQPPWTDTAACLAVSLVLPLQYSPHKPVRDSLFIL